jgi:N-dimethylarginine dimethylaminohydrolase
MACNEYGPLKRVALRTAQSAFVNQNKASLEWQGLRFHAEPDVEEALLEYQSFQDHLETADVACVFLPRDDALTLDAIYTRDALIVSPGGLILCHMGRESRRGEPAVNAATLADLGFTLNGSIEAPGTVEGGDFIWINDHAAAVGLGPRTNKDGIRQLRALLGKNVDLHVVPLSAPDHPDDVFHLMSMISPLDGDLALIYRPLMPKTFLDWLEGHDIKFVEVAEEEFIPMGCNVLALAPRRALMLDNLPQTRARLEAVGCTVETYKGDEISRKGEGGPTCLTRPLERG